MQCRKMTNLFQKNDKVLYSCKFSQYKGWWFKTKGVFVLTTNTLKILTGASKVTRSIVVKRIISLTLSSKNQKEVIIHILNEVDIHFTNNNINELL